MKEERGAINFQEAEFKEIKSDFNSMTFTIDIDNLKSQCNRMWVNSQEVK